MTRSKTILVLLLIGMMAIISCQDRSNVINPQSQSPSNSYNLPGVTIDSAVFYIYVDGAGNQTVNVHKITSNWAENSVTWNSFGEGFDPSVIGSFVSSASGWYGVDVKSLVEEWLDGTTPNYGLVLEQGLTAFTTYHSSEFATVGLRPMLRIGYTTSGGSTVVTVQRGTNLNVADAYIWQLEPDNNFGTEDILYTGEVSGALKQSLVKFDMPQISVLGAIGDFVWNDTNMNGIQDAGELGIPNVKVRLYDCSDNLLDSTMTDANGLYLFSDLEAGSYMVQFVLPSGFEFSPMDVGSNDAIDSDANATTGFTTCITLAAGQTDLTWDAGMFVPPPPPPGGCTLTIGFWKNHAGFGPQADVLTPLLPIWLGTANGAKSLDVTTAQIAVWVLAQNHFGVQSNGITKLYAQLLGAKLNIANGADGSAVSAAIADADAFLATHDWNDWTGLSNSDKQMVLGWHGTLGNYNEGLIGPGHCDQF